MESQAESADNVPPSPWQPLQGPLASIPAAGRALTRALARAHDLQPCPTTQSASSSGSSSASWWGISGHLLGPSR